MTIGRKIQFDMHKTHMFAIILLFASATFPMLALSDRSLDGSLAEPSQIPVFLAVFILMIVNIVFHRMTFRSIRSTSRPLVWVYCVAILIVIASFVLGQLISIVYAILFVFLTFNFSIIWQYSEKRRRKIFRWLSMVCLGTGLFAIALYGMPVDRYVGGIHPNFYGALVLCAGMFAALGFRRLAGPIMVICFVLASLVSSRYAMVALIIFGVIYIFRAAKVSFWLKYFGSIAGVILAVLLVRSDALVALLELNTRNRGIGSGFTGRSERWSHFWPQFYDAPILGVGFRNRDAYYGAHNGYLNVIMENGLIIGMIIIGYILYRVTIGMVTASNKEDVCASAGILAIALGSFFQPQLINFGDAMGLSLLLFLMHPNPQPQTRRRDRHRQSEMAKHVELSSAVSVSPVAQIGSVPRPSARH